MKSARSLFRPALQGVREARTCLDLAAQTGQGPRVVFLPAYGRQGAALLRIYAMAGALRAHGWRALVLPPSLSLAQRRRMMDRAAPDLVVMQGARHALNRPALYPGHRILYDLDDADFHLPHLADPVTEAMSDVACVIAGSRYIADWCRGRGAEAEIVWTGTPVGSGTRRPHRTRPPVVAWAQSAPEDYTAEAEWVLTVMRQVSAQCPEMRLRFYDRRADSPEAFLDPFKRAGLRVEWCESARYSHYLRSFDDVALGLAPLCPDNPFSRGKSFGKILAYLDRHVPVICSDVGEHGDFFDAATGVVSNDPAVWVGAITRLLAKAEARQTMADRAYAAFKTRLSVEESARRLDGVLRQYLT